MPDIYIRLLLEYVIFLPKITAVSVSFCIDFVCESSLISQRMNVRFDGFEQVSQSIKWWISFQGIQMPRLLSEFETTRGKQVPKRRELLVRRISLERERMTQIQNEQYKSGRWCLPRYTIFLFTLCWGQWFNIRREATKSSVRASLMSWILVHIQCM